MKVEKYSCSCSCYTGIWDG